ncbi:hypothetical protein, partial [Clostridium perfringens]
MRDQHAEVEQDAGNLSAELVRLSDTPERRAINEQLRDLNVHFFAASRTVVNLALQNDINAAVKLSNGDGRAARKALVEAVN